MKADARFPHEVRSFNQGMFDTLVIQKDGHDGLQRSFSDLFVNLTHFPDGTEKVRGIDTNMSYSGYLGAPLELDFYCIDIFVEDYERSEDVRKVFRSLGCRMVFGGDTTFKEFTPSMMALKLQMSHDGISGSFKDEAILNRLIERVGAGDVWPWRSTWMVDVRQRPIRIGSTDQFRVGLKGFPIKGLSGSVRLKFCLQGVLHKGGGDKL